MDSKIALEILQKAEKENALNNNKLNIIKKNIAKKHRLRNIPTNIDLLTSIPHEFINRYKDIITTKPVRTASGVAVIAIMTKPFQCPHGKCIYCPGGPKSYFGNVPQSYTGNEPATLRGIRNNFNPYLQIFNRLEQYIVMGQNPEKVELIIMGGTFPSFNKKYKTNFIRDSFKAMNDFSENFYSNNELNIEKFKKFFILPGSVNDKKRILKIQKNISLIKSKKINFQKEKLKNENSNIRCVALCIETRPDFCKKRNINELLEFGTTRVELGVQTLNENILKLINRGHTLRDIVSATQLMKDSFLKVGYHIMPGLPGISKEEDIKTFRELFSNPNYMPDALKIYPTMVMPGTELEQMYKSGKYKSLKTEDAAEIIAESKKYFPEWVRIMRVQRDIPTRLAISGVDMNNLRQLVNSIAKKKNIRCRCIHCREPKNLRFKDKIDLDNIKIRTQKYNASKGMEVFVSANDEKNDILLGFCRLRIPHKPFRREITSRSAGIRELHVYSRAVGIGKKNDNSLQHRGLGKKLLNEVEKIAHDGYDIKKLLVISGVGVRQYYYKQGYKPDGVYVSKILGR
ncbi:MAG: tRNA uridine(34) 5-carboxymethylaminomethyl modification radical SAM/GNAT enzyme Elp3 [Candidatus Woesearchaeota archaeon]